MPEEKTTLSDRERALVEAVAAERGISFEEAANELHREGLERRIRKGTRRGAARVYQLPQRRNT